MRSRPFYLAAAAAACLAGDATEASETRSVPVVTQVQGATFYRTSITISNGNATTATPVEMLFSYRSPVDGSFQTTTLELSPALGPRRVRFFDDIIQAFKDAGLIRAADVGAGLFGTLLVRFDALEIRAEAEVVARTYSPGPTGGTLGIAYEGRCYCETGSLGRVLGPARGGVFGNDGSTRANLGIINEGNNTGSGSTDVRVTYFNGDTGAQVSQFLLSSRAGHALEANEVYQLNNIFSTVPADVHTLVVQVEAVSDNFYVSSYAVQLDNTTQDGAFFFLFEE